MLVENLTRRLKNLPGYVKSKIQRKPFHWTMTRKQMENKQRRFEEQYLKPRNIKSKTRNRRNFICNKLEEKNATQWPQYKNAYKMFCLTNENVNVNEVDLNALERNLNSESLNLPLKPKPNVPFSNETVSEYTNEDSLQNARNSLLQSIEMRKPKELNTQAIELLRGSGEYEDLNLIAEYAQMLNSLQNRRSRVKQMLVKRGGKTRRRH